MTSERDCLTDRDWAAIEGYFPPEQGRAGFACKIENRVAFEGIL
jgi:hypothetical protein